MRTERHERQSRPESLQNTRGRTTTASAFTALLAAAWFDWPAYPVHLVEQKENGPSITFRRLSFARLTERHEEPRPSGFLRFRSNCNGPTEWHVVRIDEDVPNLCSTATQAHRPHRHCKNHTETVYRRRSEPSMVSALCAEQWGYRPTDPILVQGSRSHR